MKNRTTGKNAKEIGVANYKKASSKKASFKKSSSKAAKAERDFDFCKDNTFSAVVSVGPNVPEQSIKAVKIDKLDHEGGLTFDDVADAVEEEIEKTFPNESYPNLVVNEYLVFCNETGKWHPVLAESQAERIKEMEKSKKHERFLVLPEATYQVTPEARLWLALKDQSICAEFDYDKLHAMVEQIGLRNQD